MYTVIVVIILILIIAAVIVGMYTGLLKEKVSEFEHLIRGLRDTQISAQDPVQTPIREPVQNSAQTPQNSVQVPVQKQTVTKEQFENRSDRESFELRTTNECPISGPSSFYFPETFKWQSDTGLPTVLFRTGQEPEIIYFVPEPGTFIVVSNDVVLEYEGSTEEFPEEFFIGKSPSAIASS